MARVVVLEDDTVVRNLVKRVLEMNGHSVDAFDDAGGALDSVSWDEVDLLITDLQMPTPGDVAVRTLRERGYSLPIVIMTGHIERGRLNDLDIQAVVSKPFKLSELMQTVDAVL